MMKMEDLKKLNQQIGRDTCFAFEEIADGTRNLEKAMAEERYDTFFHPCFRIVVEDLEKLPLLIGRYEKTMTPACETNYDRILEWRMRNRI